MTSEFSASNADMQRMRDGLAAGGAVEINAFVGMVSGNEDAPSLSMHFARSRNLVGDRIARLFHKSGAPSMECIVNAEQAKELLGRGAIMRSGLRSLTPMPMLHLRATEPGGPLGDLPLDNLPLVKEAALDELLIAMGVVRLGDRVPDGALVEAVTIPWAALARELERNPAAMSSIDPRKFEEIVAAAYKAEGYDEVILTPASGDLGRDVIATKRGWLSVRVVDQVKRYAPGRLVPADDVRSLYGVLMRDQPATHAVLTTTSDFAPGIQREFRDLLATRLVLRNGADLRQLIAKLAQSRGR